MSNLSYSRRLFLWLVGYSLLLVGCFVAFQYERKKEFKAAELDSRLQQINGYIINELERGQKIGSIDLSDFSPLDGVRVSVIDAQGRVIYDTTPDTIRPGNHLDREEIRAAMEHSAGYAVRRHSQTTGLTYFYSARRGPQGLIVRTAVPYTVSLDSLLRADWGFIRIMAAITLVMCTLGYFATRRVGLHVMRLKRFAENVEGGERISDTAPFPHDELGEISNHLVSLYAKLQQAHADRDAEHRAALREQQEKERIKKQLTNNINHELKTPVASIQVCVETLLEHPDMAPERRRGFLERCMANTDRLKRLLADVATITRLDDGGHAIVKTRVDLAEIIADAVSDHAAQAEAKGIEIVNGINGPLELTGARELLESIFSNLLDNAIAYSGAGKISIGRLDDGADGRLVLEFADDGCGVAEEHLPRIFERFYRVDKGRSRAAGGTGLGLAIVKNAVLIHGGSIRATNRPGGGLAFTIALPRRG